MSNKQNEIVCVDIIKKLWSNSIFEKNDNREIKERPDFVFDNIGIEHFLIESNFNKTKSKNKINSITSKHANELHNLYTTYHNNPDQIYKDAEKIAKQMIDIIKENANNKADFDSETFENNFERVFNEHYFKIDNYIIENNLSKIHFLIDMPYQK